MNDNRKNMELYLNAKTTKTLVLQKEITRIYVRAVADDVVLE